MEKFIIERSITGQMREWVRSDSYPLTYTMDEAQAIMDESLPLHYRIAPAKAAKDARKYIVELLCGGKRWEKSWSYPGEYTHAEAQALIDKPCNEGYDWKATLVSVAKSPVAYRRHAAATYLELRGALELLNSTAKYLCDSYRYDQCRAAYAIICDASGAVCKQMEAL